ncbi:hypothetical protein Barb6XT_01610 [Bacteroidales bacterium Barb6XT]|nr:hypothetical protein Barb6XT_01610 [Bacteroidales bacterium Barb6XT]
MNNDTRIMILLTGGLLILDTLPEGARDFSPTCSEAGLTVIPVRESSYVCPLVKIKEVFHKFSAESGEKKVREQQRSPG